MHERRTRRAFLELTGASLAGTVGAPLVGSAQPPAVRVAGTPDPDLIVFNAKIYTVDASLPRAEAFAVKAGRFTAVGSTADVKGLTGKNTRTVDAKQMTVVPGFTDTHNHAGGTVLLYEVLVGNPFEVEFVTIASIIERLRAKARQTPAGTWVEGYFFDDTKLKDKRALNVRDLDEVSLEHPVVVRHRGGHTSYYNSRALQIAKVDKNTPNPPGGTFDRDANGELNGRVTDRARNVFNGVGRRPAFTPEQAEQRERDGLAHISKQFVRYGSPVSTTREAAWR